MAEERRAKEWYEKYRWFVTSSGKLVVGGKSSAQNEELINQVDKGAVVMHTASPGSPFCIIKEPDAKDTNECAVFTACFSQDWKKRKKKSEVHIFKGSQIVKKTGMKQGTFGIFGDVFKKKVDLKLFLGVQKGKLRAVPESAEKNKLAVLTPGNLEKEAAAGKIMRILRNKHCYPVSKDEIMAAIPSSGIDVKRI